MADKGRKFRTGGRPAAINKQNTQHGSMDMPFKSVRKFAGMKSGGKVKRYAGEDESKVSNDNDPQYPDKTNNNIYVPKAAEGMDESDDRQAAIANLRSAAPAAAKPKIYTKETLVKARFAPTDLRGYLNYMKTKTGSMAASQRVADDFEKSRGEKDLLDNAISTGNKAKRAGAGMPKARLTQAQMASGAEEARKRGMSSSSPKGAYENFVGKTQPTVTPAAKTTVPPVAKATGVRDSYTPEERSANREAVAQSVKKTASSIGNYFKDLVTKTRAERYAEANPSKLAKGGNVKTKMSGMSGMGGMHKMPDGKMMKDSAMKKSGMPMKDGKPAFMKKFVKGGGIESINDAKYFKKKKDELAERAQLAREIGRKEGAERQNTAAGRGGVLGTPVAYIERAGQYIGDKFDDADAYLSEKMGMQDRATFKKGVRQGLKDEGYKKGGMAGYAKGGGIESKGKTKGTVIRMASGGSVSSASRRADGIAQRGKTRC
jgi:hypothetical protein